MPLQWRRDEIEKFIMLVRQKNCIYNSCSSDYRDREKKAQAFDDILAEMRKIVKNITLMDLKKKLKNLRTQYMAERRLMERPSKAGVEVYKPKLWCYGKLSFLEKHTQTKTHFDRIEDNKNNESIFEDPLMMKTEELTYDNFNLMENCYHSLDESSGSLHPSTPRGEIKVKDNVTLHAIMKNINNLNNKKKSSRKKFEWLGALVVSLMEEIDPKDQLNAAWKVQCLMRQLVEESAKEKNTAETHPNSELDTS